MKYINNILVRKYPLSILKTFVIGKELKSRGCNEIKREWENCGIMFEKIFPLFCIINEFSNWPNNLFLPQDEILYLFKGYECSLCSVEIVMKIESFSHIKLINNLYKISDLHELVKFTMPTAGEPA